MKKRKLSFSQCQQNKIKSRSTDNGYMIAYPSFVKQRLIFSAKFSKINPVLKSNPNCFGKLTNLKRRTLLKSSLSHHLFYESVQQIQDNLFSVSKKKIFSKEMEEKNDLFSLQQKKYIKNFPTEHNKAQYESNRGFINLKHFLKEKKNTTIQSKKVIISFKAQKTGRKLCLIGKQNLKPKNNNTLVRHRKKPERNQKLKNSQMTTSNKSLKTEGSSPIKQIEVNKGWDVDSFLSQSEF